MFCLQQCCLKTVGENHFQLQYVGMIVPFGGGGGNSIHLKCLFPQKKKKKKNYLKRFSFSVWKTLVIIS